MQIKGLFYHIYFHLLGSQTSSEVTKKLKGRKKKVYSAAPMDGILGVSPPNSTRTNHSINQ